MKVFALTFAYNEHFFLPRWVAYYGAQVGHENLFVLDHGSTDGSCEGLGRVNVISVPRSDYDEVKRVDFASHFHRALLNYYDAGFAMDVDEFIVADPAKYRNLQDFAARGGALALACIGLELLHARSREADFVASLPILAQRHHVLFDSWICKRSFARVPVRFGGGFHTSTAPVEFDDDLFLFHLKNFDYQHRLERQVTTSQWDYAGNFGDHAKRPVDYVKSIFDGVDDKLAAGQLSTDFAFREERQQCLDRTVMNPSSEYDFNLQGGFQSARLHVVPPHFRHLF